MFWKNICSNESLDPGSEGNEVQVIAVPQNGATLGIWFGSYSFGP